MTQYFAVAEGWKPSMMLWSNENDARKDARDILMKTSSRKQVSVYASNGHKVWYIGAVVPGGAGYRYVDKDGNSSAVNSNGSLRAKPSPRSFI